MSTGEGAGKLWVVATPLGNLSDFSQRARQTLAEADLIACEDTRVTRKLLVHFAIDTPTTSFHEHNEETKTPSLIARLKKGEAVALVSDAGTPLLSDPGYRLVKACREEEIAVIPVPGPFAGAAAVSVSGLATDRVLFAGFLPSKASAQRKALDGLSALEMTLVLYLSPHRIERSLGLLIECLGDRQAFLIREMTKLHETAYYGRLSVILEKVDRSEQRGEFTLVVGGAQRAPSPLESLDAFSYVTGLMAVKGLSQKEAIKRAASELGISKNEVYALVVSADRERSLEG